MNNPTSLIQLSGVVKSYRKGHETVIALDGDGGFAVETHAGALRILALQPSGGRPMPASEYLRGHREIVGRRFGDPQ